MATEILTTETITRIAVLHLQAADAKDAVSPAEKEDKQQQEEPYRYAHLLPVFSNETYPPLEPYEHADPGQRALAHSNARSFLDNATSVHDLTPNLGTEIHGVNLAALNSDERDQIALEVREIVWA